MKFNTQTRNNIVSIICYLYVVLLTYAATSKLLDFENFRIQLGQSPLLSAFAFWISIAVPVSEFIIAILLLIPKLRFLGLFAAYSLMVMFTAYIVIILNFTDFIPCSCGGVLEELGWTEHLVFNIFFILMLLFAFILLVRDSEQGDAIILQLKKVIRILILITVISISIVVTLFLSSEKQIKRNNAFIRRYVPHPIEKIGSYDLEYNSYYIAGIAGGTIYLGNVTTPLQLMRIDTKLTNVKTFKVTIDAMDLSYRRVKISVKAPHFYVSDGTVPIILKGKMDNWHATTFSYEDAFFTQNVVVDSVNVGIATISASTNARALGLIEKDKDSFHILVNSDILTKQIDGKFDSDGILLYNHKHNLFIYTYYYRNSYKVVDESLAFQYTGKTIDTISNVQLDIAHNTTTNQYKLGPKSVFVNRHSATNGDYLHIHSDRLGRYEDDGVLRSASIIDVYNIMDNSYVFSYYLYHQAAKKISEIHINNNLLVAIVDDQLWLYRLKPEYFKTQP